jgi:hypothetical protein
MLVLDAFNSDSVPPHLLSQEALELYLSKLKPDGVLLFHVSNRYLRVKDLVAALVVDRGLSAFGRIDHADATTYKSGSQYVLAGTSRDGTFASRMKAHPLWEPVVRPHGLSIWTDDYSNMVALLRWLPAAK